MNNRKVPSFAEFCQFESEAKASNSKKLSKARNLNNRVPANIPSFESFCKTESAWKANSVEAFKTVKWLSYQKFLSIQRKKLLIEQQIKTVFTTNPCFEQYENEELELVTIEDSQNFTGYKKGVKYEYFTSTNTKESSYREHFNPVLKTKEEKEEEFWKEKSPNRLENLNPRELWEEGKRIKSLLDEANENEDKELAKSYGLELREIKFEWARRRNLEKKYQEERNKQLGITGIKFEYEDTE